MYDRSCIWPRAHKGKTQNLASATMSNNNGDNILLSLLCSLVIIKSHQFVIITAIESTDSRADSLILPRAELRFFLAECF